tara:strand:- start:1874 stop:3070 length:1197 start_codon:yes stop_codon:yes gene_type:complete
MTWNRQTRGLAQRKVEKPQLKNNEPLDSEGNIGELSLRKVKDGVFLFFKSLGKWSKIFNSSNSMIPDKPNTYDIGSPNKPWRSGYFSSDSVHIGSDASSRITVGLTGEGENVQLNALTPSGNVAPYASSNLQYVEGDVVLDNSAIFYNAIDGSSIASTGNLTIETNSEFSVLSKDPSVEEEARINNRLRFDAEVAYSLGNIHNKFNYLKNEVAAMNTMYCNRLVEHLSSKDINLINEEEKASLTQPRSRPAIGGNWTFDFTGGAHEDLWTCTQPHGLLDNDRIKFTTSAVYPTEFSIYRDYYVIVKSATTVQLKIGELGSVVEGTADSSGNWKAHMAYDPDGESGGLPYSDDYMPGTYQPDLVEGENYTTGGVCSLSDYKTENSCIKAGGTWYPPETI